jgi:hypothetical protein
MDLSFFRRAWAGSGESSPAALDYRVLVASLQAIQSSTPTARAEAHCRGVSVEPLGQDQRPLAALLLGQPDWPAAVALQNGSFNRAAARNPVNLR